MGGKERSKNRGRGRKTNFKTESKNCYDINSDKNNTAYKIAYH